jgi:hypothetical protein
MVKEDMMEAKDNRRRNSVTLIIVAAALLACNLSRLRPGSSQSASNNNRPSTANNSNTTTRFDPAGDPRQNLKDAYLKLKDAYPFRLTETTTSTAGGTNTQPSVRVAEFAAADRIHTTLNGSELGITFGDKHYIYSNGKWVESGPPVKGSPANLEKLMDSSVKDVQPVGTETVNGVPCIAYNVNFEWNLGGQPATATAKTWIGLADGLPHQVDGDWKVATYETKSHIVYEYNVDIHVEKPAQ